MVAKRNTLVRRLAAGAAVEPEKASDCRDRTVPRDALPPRAGRTGGLGARAERPSEGSRRKPGEKEVPRRGAKAPSARKTAHSDERSSR